MECIPDANEAANLIKKKLQKKSVDNEQLEFLLRCAAAVSGKWNKVQKIQGKKKRQTYKKAVTLSDLAFTVCVLEHYLDQWTDKSKAVAASGSKEERESEPEEEQKQESGNGPVKKKRTRIGCPVRKDFVNRYMNLKKELQETEAKHKGFRGVAE